MDEPVSSADANRNFSTILRGVRAGTSYLVTSHGRPVARIIPAGEDAAQPAGKAASPDTAASGAKAALLARLERQSLVRAQHWSRDDLYERER